MTKPDQDRALHAVRRVRDVREQDSRFGLSIALASVRDREAQAEEAARRVETAEPFGAGSVADFRGHVDRLSALVQLQGRAAANADASRLVAEEARNRWQHDRQQVRVVDLLLERRAAERAEARARRQQAELDDLATQSWLRQRNGSHDQPDRTAEPDRIQHTDQIRHTDQVHRAHRAEPQGSRT